MASTSTPKDVLETAHELIRGERAKHYGPPHDNFEVIANLWHEYLRPTVVEIIAQVMAESGAVYADARELADSTVIGKIVDENDVCNLMSLLKIAREATGRGYHEDSTVDVCGYQGIKQLLQMPRDDFMKEIR